MTRVYSNQGMQTGETPDPRPTEYRGTASERLPSLLKNIKGQQQSISLMLDRDCCHKQSDKISPEGCRRT